MKPKHNEGFSLVEVLVAIAVLGVLVVPTCTSLLTAIRINTATEDMRQAQLAVSSAVETLMAEGIPQVEADREDERDEAYRTRFPDVSITITDGNTDNYFRVKVASNLDGLDSVFAETYIPCEDVRNPGEGGA